MSIFDHKRLTNDTFKLDAERMRAGWYSDKYFENIVGMLTDLARRTVGRAPDAAGAASGAPDSAGKGRYGFGGHSTRLAEAGIDARGTGIGNIGVGMQGFTRRQPVSAGGGCGNAPVT